MTRLLAALLALAAAAFALSLAAGEAWLGPADWLGAERWIFLELRLPRALLGLGLGFGLGLTGAALQAWLRNPLADPGLFGVSASAALGAVVLLFFGLATPVLLGAAAFAGAGAGLALLVLLAGRGAGVLTLTLAGVALSAIAGALTALVVSLAPSPFLLAALTTWLMGALIDRSMAEAAMALPAVAAGCASMALTARSLDALSLGEPVARSMGVDMRRVQAALLAGSALVVGGAVAAAGVIGFVGLVAPHLVRPFTDGRPSSLLLPAGLAGAALTLFADAIVRLLPGGSELRLGVATALIGAPFFVALLLRVRRQAA